MKNIVFCIPASMTASENQRNEIMAFVSGLNQRHGSDEMRIRCEICENISGEPSPEAHRQDTVYVPVGKGAEDVKQRILLALTEEMGPDAPQEESAAPGLPRTAGKRANPREEKALRLLGEGEYEKALSALRDPAWKEECRRAEEEMQLSQRKLESGLETICQYIFGQRTLIRTLEFSQDREAAAGEIRAIYEEITHLAEKYAACAWVFCDYADFLYERNRFDAGLTAADRFDALIQAHPEAANDVILARMAQIRGRLFSGRKDFAAGEAAYRRALEIGLQCARRDLGESEACDLAKAMDALAKLQQRDGRFQEAEETYRRGLEGLRPLEEQDPEEYDHLLEDAMSRFAELLRRNGRLWEAERVYRRLVEIYESWDLEFEQAEYLCALAHLLEEDCHRPQEAEELYRQAMENLICLEGHQPGTCAQFGRLRPEHRLPAGRMDELQEML